jgi:hypothetical protein
VTSPHFTLDDAGGGAGFNLSERGRFRERGAFGFVGAMPQGPLRWGEHSVGRGLVGVLVKWAGNIQFRAKTSPTARGTGAPVRL